MSTSKKTPADRKKIPLRACIGCRESKPKQELVRIVRTPESKVVVDGPKGKLNGRGAYICAQVACFDLAIKKKALNHVLKVTMTTEETNAVKDGFIKRLINVVPEMTNR